MLGHIPKERIHIKTEVWWLIESESPALYASDLSTSLQLTENAWCALKFPTKESAAESLNGSYYGKSRNWRILEHLFYV